MAHDTTNNYPSKKSPQRIPADPSLPDFQKTRKAADDRQRSKTKTKDKAESSSQKRAKTLITNRSTHVAALPSLIGVARSGRGPTTPTTRYLEI